MTRRPKLLLDEMLSGEIAAQLRARGHDVRAVLEDPALVSTSDWDLLEYVTAQGRCLVTANVRDFAALSATWNSRDRSHPGLVYLVAQVFAQDRSLLGAVVRSLDQAITTGQLPSNGAEVYLRRRNR